MLIDEKHAPVYRDATILLRPKTGLKDMFLELDPGTKAAGPMREGERISVSNTLPDVNPDEMLAQLDGDTRAYLRVLLNSVPRRCPARARPTARDLQALRAHRPRRRARSPGCWPSAAATSSA